MALRISLLLLFSTLFSLSVAQSPQKQGPIFKPTALILPVLKDNETSLHVAQIHKRTPLTPIPLLVDLNGKFLVVDCENNYSSWTYNAPFCHSTQCARVGSHYCHKCLSTRKPGCHNNTCAVQTRNPFTNQNVEAEISEDALGIQSLQGLNPGPLVVSPRFLFACAQSRLLLQGPFPKNVQGIVGLSHDRVSLPVQLSSHFGIPFKFALCLASQDSQNGVVFFGNATYNSRGKDYSQGLHYTPLSIGPQGEYIIQVKSIRINHKDVGFNKSLISRTRSFGGAIISTTRPYTTLETQIYRTFIQFFTKEILASGSNQVDPISPFGACFKNLKQEQKTGGPTIEFMMQNRNVTWTLYGPNTLVEAREGVWCLAFVEAGQNPKAPIVIGAHQFEDYVVEFDLTKSQLGFSESLNLSNASCSQFNFNTTRPPHDQVLENSGDPWGMIPQDGNMLDDETIDP